MKNFVITMFVFVLFFSTLSVAPGVEAGFDECESGGGWSEPESNAKQCGWPPGNEGHKTDCCCCYIKTHVHDLGDILPGGTIEIEYKPGNYKGCTSNMKVYYSADGESWENFYEKSVTQQTWSPKTTYSEEIDVPGEFRYIKIYIPSCYVDYSSAEVIDETTTTTSSIDTTSTSETTTTETTTIVENETSCYDSDGGKNYYVKGYAEDYDGKAWDICTAASVSGYEGEEEYVFEKYCVNGEVAGAQYHCPYGCEDGACLEEEEETCYDSDGGKDYYEKGTVEKGDEEYTDTCWESEITWCGSSNSNDFCLNCYKNGGRVKSGESGCWCDSKGTYVNAWYGECPEPTSLEEITWCGSSNSKDFCMNCYSNGGRVKSGESGCWCDSKGIYINAWHDECPSPEDKLTEYYCHSDEIKSKGYLCENGCENGACIKEVSECTDSDGGKNYYEKGTAVSGDTKLSDHCNSDGSLTEKYCENGEIKWHSYECEHGCNKGACIMGTTTSDYTLNPIDDTLINYRSKGTNYGSSEGIKIRNRYGTSDTVWEWSGLIKFDLSSIKSESIKSAKLYLYYYDKHDSSPVGRKINLKRIEEDWDEDSVTAGTAPEYTEAISAHSKVPSSYGWMSWDVTEDVKDFLSGEVENYGWRIADDNYWGHVNIPIIRFRSKEYGEYKPRLEIEVSGEEEPEYGYDVCENDKGWSEPKKNAQACGWPPGEEGYKVDCCCCYMESHIHDVGKVFNPSEILLQYTPGWAKNCTSEMYVYYSKDGDDWSKFHHQTVTQETWSPKTTYNTTLDVPSKFRYIRVYIPECYVDFSAVQVESESEEEEVCDSEVNLKVKAEDLEISEEVYELIEEFTDSLSCNNYDSKIKYKIKLVNGTVTTLRDELGGKITDSQQSLWNHIKKYLIEILSESYGDREIEIEIEVEPVVSSHSQGEGKEEKWEEYGKCDGCEYDYKCITYGTRVEKNEVSYYCGLEGELEEQKSEQESCMNNYECTSNFCSDGKCYDIRGDIEETRSVVDLIVDFLRNMFSFGQG